MAVLRRWTGSAWEDIQTHESDAAVGAIPFSTGAGIDFTDAGHAGQVLKSTGGATPEWGNLSDGAWAEWIPVWSATGTQPVIGNGIFFNAHYSKVGKTVHCVFVFLIGANSTMGTGTWMFSLPVTALNSNSIASANVVLGVYSTGTKAIGAPDMPDVNHIQIIIGGATPSTVTPTTPWSWATNDSIVLGLTYEAAD